MSEYAPTMKGDAIATEAGVPELLDEVAKNLRLEDSIYDLVEEPHKRNIYDEQGNNNLLDEALRRLIPRLTYEDSIDLQRGLYISEEDTWKQVTGISNHDRLFAVPRHDFLSKTHQTDALVLSGIIGSLLKGYSNRFPVLQPQRCHEYGFNTYIGACAFIGSFVLSKQLARLSGVEKSTQYTFLDGNTVHKIGVTGTMHGDFRLVEQTAALSDVIAPNGLAVDFSPIIETVVAGYHSVEPYIVNALVISEMFKGGKAAALQLVLQIKTRLDELVNAEGELAYTVGNFADYGDGEMDFVVSEVEFMVENPEYFEFRKQENKLHSSPYLPQSKTYLEIVPSDEGVLLYNTNTGSDDNQHRILITRDKYLDFLESIVGQTQAGLGRTSPIQIVELIYRLSQVLA